MLYPDALAAAAQLNQGRRYHQLDQIEVVSHPYYTQAGRPRKGQAPDGYHYRLQGTVTLKSEGVIKSDGVKRSPSRRLRINWASLQLRQRCALVFQSHLPHFKVYYIRNMDRARLDSEKNSVKILI